MAKKNTVVGLDIGRSTAKAVWMEGRGTSFSVTRSESIRLPAAAADAPGVVASWLDSLDIKGVPCVLGLAGQKTMFQPFAMAASDPRSMEQAAEIELLKFNEMASENMIHGFSPIALGPDERRIMMAMAREAMVQEALDFGRNTGLKVVDIVPSPVALFAAVDAAASAREAAPWMVINIGGQSSEVVIGSPAGLLFARAFPSGGQAFTDAIARKNGQTYAQAENLKVTEGSLLPGAPTAAILTAAADPWLGELRACLSVFQSLYPGRTVQPTRIVLAGGGAELKGFREYVAQKLGTGTVKLEAIPGGSSANSQAALYAVAAGLAMAGLGVARKPISLLPPAARDALTFRRQQPFWVGAGLAAAAIVAINVGGGYYDSMRMASHLSAQKERLRACDALGYDIDITRARAEQVRAMSLPVKGLTRGSALLRDILSVVSDAKAPGDSISMVCDADSYFAGNTPAADPRQGMRDHRKKAGDATELKPRTGLERILIEGYTRTANLSTVKALINKLKTVPSVASADLINDDELVAGPRSEGPGGIRFMIDVRIAPP